MGLERSGMISRLDAKMARNRKTVTDRRAAYRLVDLRDEGKCRACKCLTFLRMGLDQREHHHIHGRQIRNAEQTSNIVTLCRRCHDLRHVKRTLVIVGNADQTLTFELDGKVWHG